MGSQYFVSADERRGEVVHVRTRGAGDDEIAGVAQRVVGVVILEHVRHGLSCRGKALDRAEEASPYKDAIKRMLANVVDASLDERQPLLVKHPVEKNVLFIIIASDRGLAGGFNVMNRRE